MVACLQLLSLQQDVASLLPYSTAMFRIHMRLYA